MTKQNKETGASKLTPPYCITSHAHIDKLEVMGCTFAIKLPFISVILSPYL